MRTPCPAAGEALPFDVYARDCPTRLVLDRLADKWVLLVMRRLRGGAVRFNQLKRDIDGVSQKVLSQTLKNLERDGLIERHAFATVPVTVEYTLTALGHTLDQTVESLSRWAESNIEAVMAAQRDYDAARAASEPAG